jgi:hypothetical protein
VHSDLSTLRRESVEKLSERSEAQAQDELDASAAAAAQRGGGTLMAVDATAQASPRGGAGVELVFCWCKLDLRG